MATVRTEAAVDDITLDGGVWRTSRDQGKMLTVNWRMHKNRLNPAARRIFNLREDYLLMQTRHCGVIRQRPRDYFQLTLQGLMYKIERGGCPLCCGDEMFRLTLQTRESSTEIVAAAAARKGLVHVSNIGDVFAFQAAGGNPESVDHSEVPDSPRMPGDGRRSLPRHRLLMENWLECHCDTAGRGGVTRLEMEVDVGYVEDGATPRDGAAHLMPPAQARIHR